MTLESDKKVVKLISTWRYEISIKKDSKDIYYVIVTNTLTNKTRQFSFVDFSLANFIFEAHYNNFEGSSN